MERVKKFIQILISNRFFLFLFFWITISIVYIPAYKAGYMAEFINYLQSYMHGSFSSFLNREDAYVKSLYQVVQLQRYIFFSVFWVNPYFWFFLLTGLHAVNGILIYTFFSRLLSDFKVPSANIVVLAGTILFLFSPNITEITVWKATEHYLTGVMMQLLIVIWVQNYLHTTQTKYAWFAGILFAITTYTLEIFYVTPFITLFLIIGYWWKGLVSKEVFKKSLYRLYLPQLLLFLAHLITFRLIYGTWVAHYGTTDEFVWSFSDMLSGYGKYLAFISINTGHYAEATRMAVYAFLKQPVVAYTIVGLLLAFLIISLLRFKKLNSKTQILVFLTGILVCSLTLVVTIFFDELFSLYNSRRSYQAGIFLYLIIAILIFSIRNKKIALGVFIIYFSWSLFLTGKMVFRWRHAAQIQRGLLASFHWQEKNPVILLNIPNYYRDVRIIPATKDNEFKDQQKIFGYPVSKGDVYTVVSYNMQDIWNGAHVTVLDSMTLKVTLNQWGTWWMYGYAGAGSYENELYKVDMTDAGHEYILRLKQKPENMVILFQEDIFWKEVDMKTLGEQW